MVLPLRWAKSNPDRQFPAEICASWLQNQFGSDERELKSQKPVPMRVICSATGPKDDPSMYRGAS
jgi:hypothetical protein